MVMLPNQFNAEDHGNMGFDPLPKDNYLMQITESDYKENSNKNGHFLSLKMEVQEGEYKGRVLFRNLNLDNPNPKAVDMANKELASICRACGLTTLLEDSEELHGIDFIASLAVKKGKGDAADEQTVQSYAPAAGVAKPAKPSDDSAAAAKPKASRKPIFDEDED